MTTANKITILRILLIPFFIVLVVYYVKTGHEIYRFSALLTFALAAISDALDGYIARHYNQRSELGAALDPLADKLLLLSGIIILSFDHSPRLPQVPLWFTATILSRDVLLILGLGVIYFVGNKPVVRPILIGKLATVLQMATVLWCLFNWKPTPMHWIAGAAALCTAVSGFYYIYDGIRQLSSSPSSAATPPE